MDTADVSPPDSTGRVSSEGSGGPQDPPWAEQSAPSGITG